MKKLTLPVLKNTSKAPDTLTISRINKLADEFFKSNPDSTYYYGNLEIKLSEKINYQMGIADGTNQLAVVNTFHGNYATAAKNYKLALNIYQKINNIRGISKCYIGLGRIQNYLGNYDNAINLYNKALVLSKKGNAADLSECYNLLGITYDNKGDFSKALDYYFKSLTIDIRLKNNLSAANKYSNIGTIMQQLELYPKALGYYNHALRLCEQLDNQQGISTACRNIGETLIAQKDYKSAIGYLNRASKIFNKLNDYEGTSLIYYNLGLYNYYTHHTNSAIHYLKFSLKTAKQNKIKYNRANTYVGLAQVYNAEKDYQQAYNYAVKGQIIATRLKSLSVMTDAALQASEALAGLKRFKQAYRQHKLYSVLKSDLKHNESIHKVMLYNLEMDFANKQKDIINKQYQTESIYQKKIARQKNQDIIYAIIIVVMATLVVVYYNEKRKQQKINSLLAEKNRETILHQENLSIQTAKLNELNLLKDRLIGVLAHDLRAPISTLRGLFNLMTDDAITSEEFIEMTPKVFSTLEHTSDFLDTLLFWINSQVDRSENTIKSFYIDDLITRELVHMEDKLKQKNISVHVKMATDAIALADPNAIRIVIHNFLTNAIKFSNRNGIIEATSYVQDAEIMFCLKDNGVGMSDEFLNTLFKSQVNSSKGTENESGTGMGLMFCKDLIEKHNGKIWAKSTLGVGTELCFSLPVGDNSELRY
ncbi:tetratricopeptide repeat-containing sensor histidine kinase [Mucilaginibacter sp.]|uniref:tetratricopeptide repeat-containing sensor histidine kinase n=1 Tax=Mucilaginibacter sp. TaxID=1882438 RepID=UPI00260A8874|nr:tetratricopeptide repeat-containing sensor histidine kinase [Mucilaginibacter sp.]